MVNVRQIIKDEAVKEINSLIELNINDVKVSRTEADMRGQTITMYAVQLAL